MKEGRDRWPGIWGGALAVALLLTGCTSFPPATGRHAEAPPALPVPLVVPGEEVVRPAAADPASGKERGPAAEPACPADPIGDLIEAQEPPASTPGERALATASRLLGVRYAFGGDSPDGFDCSGLVRYAFREAGVEMPRTSRAMFGRTWRVALDRLEPGDLVFFQVSGKRISHVGIYAGEGRFIHSPSRGKEVTYSSLDEDYWRRRLVGAGRVLVPASPPPAVLAPPAPEG